MNLIALLLGLLLEKVSTSLFNLRETRWLDGFFDKGLALTGDGRVWSLDKGEVVFHSAYVSHLGPIFATAEPCSMVMLPPKISSPTPRVTSTRLRLITVALLPLNPAT